MLLSRDRGGTSALGSNTPQIIVTGVDRHAECASPMTTAYPARSPPKKVTGSPREGVRSEPASGATTGGGGRAALPRPGCVATRPSRRDEDCDASTVEPTHHATQYALFAVRRAERRGCG